MEEQLELVLVDGWWEHTNLTTVRALYDAVRRALPADPGLSGYADRLEDKAWEMWDVCLEREWDCARISEAAPGQVSLAPRSETAGSVLQRTG